MTWCAWSCDQLIRWLILCLWSHDHVYKVTWPVSCCNNHLPYLWYSCAIVLFLLFMSIFCFSRSPVVLIWTSWAAFLEKHKPEIWWRFFSEICTDVESLRVCECRQLLAGKYYIFWNISPVYLCFKWTAECYFDNFVWGLYDGNRSINFDSVLCE